MDMYKISMLTPDNLYPLMGRTIRNLRIEQNMTQERLAELIDGDQKYISRIEAGKAKPGLSFYLKIANVFQVSIDKFLVDAIELNDSESSLGNWVHYPLGNIEEILIQDILDTVLKYLRKKE